MKILSQQEASATTGAATAPAGGAPAGRDSAGTAANGAASGTAAGGGIDGGVVSAAAASAVGGSASLLGCLARFVRPEKLGARDHWECAKWVLWSTSRGCINGLKT